MRIEPRVEAACHDGSREIEGVVIDVSRSGVLLRTPDRPEVGRMLVLNLRFPSGVYEGFGRVVRSATTETAIWLDDLLPEDLLLSA